MMAVAGFLLAASKTANSSHPLWHYVVIPAIGVVLFAVIAVPDFIRGIRRRGEEPSDHRASASNPRR
jgi:hypothetical protein